MHVVKQKGRREREKDRKRQVDGHTLTFYIQKTHTGGERRLIY